MPEDEWKAGIVEGAGVGSNDEITPMICSTSFDKHLEPGCASPVWSEGPVKRFSVGHSEVLGRTSGLTGSARPGSKLSVGSTVNEILKQNRSRSHPTIQAMFDDETLKLLGKVRWDAEDLYNHLDLTPEERDATNALAERILLMADDDYVKTKQANPNIRTHYFVAAIARAMSGVHLLANMHKD